jgi:putative ABC transport system permease protein
MYRLTIRGHRANALERSHQEAQRPVEAPVGRRDKSFRATTLRLTTRQLWAHKLRFALTGLAVVLGVAFMAGTMVLTDTMGKSFNGLFESANAGVDVIVQQPETIEASDVRERVPASTIDEIRSVDGVRSVVGTVQGFAQLVKADGTVAAPDGLGVTIGANWVDEDLNPFDLANGHAPRGPTEAVLDKSTAQREGWALGDTFSVLTQDGPHEFTLVGTATMGALEGIPGSSLVATDDATAQALFGQADHYDSVAVAAADGVTSAELAERIDTALGHGTFEVLTGEADTAAKEDQFQKDVSFFNQFLMAFAYVSLFVGMFIIYNTFSIVVAQRKKDMAMLRAIGASRRQLLISVLIESTVVGIVASAAGLAGGVVMSMGLKALLSTVGLDIPTGSLVISTGTVITAFAVGLTVTLVSAMAPAVRASRVAPIAALRDVSIDRSASSIVRTIAGLAITGLGVAAFAGGVVGSGQSAVQLLGMGAITVVLGIFVLGPVIARPMVRLIGWPAARLSGTTGRLARENATRSPKRTSATASALMVGVALVGFITILASSTKESVAGAVDHSMRADYVLDSGAWDQGGFSPALADELAALPQVAEVAPLRSSAAEVDGHSVRIQGTDTSTIDDLFDLEVVSGSMDDVKEGSLAMNAHEAEKYGLTVGDTVEAKFPAGSTTLTLAAIYDSTLAERYLVDLPTFEANVTDQFDQMIYIGATEGTTAEQSREALETALAEYPNAELQDQAQFKQSITSEIDKMLNLIYGLLALAVIIALIGIANTLALSVHERTREVGLLRAVGMTRGQLKAAIRWESVMIALLGTALGAVIAVGGAWGIVQAMGTAGVTAFKVPVVQMAAIVGLAAFAGVLAALGPARRAAKLNVLDAIATQ